MGFIAEYELSNPVILETRRAIPEMELEVEDEQLAQGESFRLIFWARGPEEELERLDQELADDPTIRDYEFFSKIEERRLFRITLSSEGERGLTYVIAIEYGITFLEILAKGDTVTYRAQLPNREALRKYREECQERDLSFELLRLYRSDDTESTGLDITERQREVLLLALDRGYYEVPRGITTEELAAEFDISSQALSALLRRGHKALLRSTIAQGTSI